MIGFIHKGYQIRSDLENILQLKISYLIQNPALPLRIVVNRNLLPRWIKPGTLSLIPHFGYFT